MKNKQYLFAPMTLALCFQAYAQGTQANENDVESIVVIGTQDSGEISVGRNSLDADEQARSIQIFDEEFIQRLKPKNIESVVTLSSNIVFTGNNDGRENTFAIRGFDNAPVLRDGFRITSFGGITDPEIFNLERAEVLKGPDSIVYGEANPGGIINLVTKRPKNSNHTILSVETGSNPSFSPRFDVNRSSGNVAYRVVGLYDYDEGFRDYDNAEKRYSLVPSARWEPVDGTVFTYIGEYVEEDGPADFGTAMDQFGELTASIRQVNNHPSDTMDRDFYMTGLDFEQRLSESLTAEARVRYFDTEYKYSVLWLPGNYNPLNNQYARVAASQGQSTEEWAAQFNLFGEFEMGTVRNRFVAGLDYRDTDSVGGGVFGPAVMSVIDWRNPDYSEQPLTGNEDNLFPYGFADDSKRYAAFFQNHTDITDNLLVSLGVRYDDVETESLQFGMTDTTLNETDETVFQGAVRYRFNDSISIFANYSESFNPSSSRDRNGDLLEPEVGEGFEIGLKGKLLGEQLGYTAALFDITKTNVALGDPDFLFASVASGEQNVQGAEIDIYGNITEQLSITASLGYIDGEDENDQPMPRAVDFTSSAYITYTSNNNWDASFGWSYNDKRRVINNLMLTDEDDNVVFDGAVDLDAQLIFNAGFGYEKGSWRGQLNLSNLTDERYVANAFGSLGRSVHPGAPFEALFTLTYSME